MNKNITILQLIDSKVKGHLDVKSGSDAPINLAISDIRDISSRTGMYSKTITLSGNKNNNKILNNYFDVNVTDGTFNVNKKQKVAVIQNGVLLKDNCFMRLLKVVKKQNLAANVDDYIEYEVQVTDGLGDFFKDASNKEVRELTGWESFGHTYNVSEIIESFGNNVNDGYKYILPHITPLQNGESRYQINEILPGIYAKQIFDKIHEQNDMTYEWSTLADEEFQFDKSIIPYSGDKKKLSDDYIKSVKVIADNPTVQETGKYILGNGINNGHINSTPISTSNEIKDDSNWFNPTTSIYTNTLTIDNPNTLDYIIKVDYDIVFVNDYSYGISLTQAFQRFTSNLRIVDTNGNTLKHTNRLPLVVNPINSSISEYGTSGNEIRINHLVGQNWSPGETIVASGNETFNISLTGLNGTEELRLEVNANMNNSAGSQWRRTGTFDAVDMKMKIVIKSIEMEISPGAQNGLMPGTDIDLKMFLPNNVKQSDFLKSIYQKYNLYVLVDENDPNHLKYVTRDEFYDSGTVHDWTELLAKEKNQELLFLPEVTTKKMVLSYKDDDKDSLLTAYRSEVAKTFGQVAVTFDNENVRGEERKEEIFSPTINMTSDFGAVLPVLPADFKMNIRYLQDGGQYGCNNYQIASGGTITNHQIYPHISMFDKPFDPTFSIEYALSDFYAYNPGVLKKNTLYNLHWRRTLSQINSGKMFKAYFNINEKVFSEIKLNDKIKVNNNIYYINRIVDYNSNNFKPTLVELLTVEDALTLPKIGNDVITSPNYEEVVDELATNLSPKLPVIDGSFFGGALSDNIRKRINANTVISAPTLLDGNMGIGNNIPSGFNGIIIGDNITPTENGVYIDDLSVTSDGIFKTDSNGDQYGITIDDDGNVIFDGTVDFSNANIPELDDKEDKSNKVQDLNNPDAITYPSTDAVKNALDDKVESVTGTGVDNTDPINPIITIDKSTIGLGNVDNTSDVNKPISTATQTALNAKANTSTQVIAGNGLTGGGTLAANRTITLGTPGAIGLSTTNSVTSTSHTHALNAATITAINNGQTAFGWGNFRDYGLGLTEPGLLSAISEVGSGFYWSNQTTVDAPFQYASIISAGYGSGPGRYNMFFLGNNTNRIVHRRVRDGNFYDMEIWHNLNLTDPATETWVNQQISNISIPTVNNGQLTLSTGTGLSGSATFTANQSGGSTFSVTVASTHKLPTITEWNALPTTNTITRLRGTTSGTYTSGDLTLINGTGIGITQSGSNFTITNTSPNIIQTLSQSGQTITLSNSGGSVTIPFTDWSDIPNKPSTFTPSTHTHTINQVTGLQNALNNKEDKSNKVQDLSSPNAITYPSTNAVKDAIDNISLTPGPQGPQGIQGPQGPQGIKGDDGSMTIIPITYIDLKTLKSNNSLVPGIRYFITDRDIWIDALDTDKLAMECKRHFRIVKDEFYTPHTVSAFNNNVYCGIYGQSYAKGSTPNSSTLFGGNVYFAIWGGRIWQRHTSRPDTPGINNFTIQDGWVLQTTTNNAFYESKIFDIKYNFDDDIIWEQSDDRGNKIKRRSSGTSYIDNTDWGNVNIYNNENFGIYNNFRFTTTKALIFNNSNGGNIYNNKGGIIGENKNNGGIYSNSSDDIVNNSNGSDIYNNSNVGFINGNSNSGYIRDNLNEGQIIGNTNIGSISNNSNIGDIENNSNNGIIDDNSNSGGIDSNSNIGNIFNNSNNGIIEHNSNNGSISNNSNTLGGALNTGDIQDNSNSGPIQDNSNSGPIQDNSNSGGISNNSNSGTIEHNSNGGIYNNSNNGSIFNNSNNGIIQDNSNSGSISNNSNIGDIFKNSNIGFIAGNSNNGIINFNSNNGTIQQNTSTGSTTFSINNNQNNGNILNNRSTANIFIQRNTNNGRIGPETGTTSRTSSISEPEVTK